MIQTLERVEMKDLPAKVKVELPVKPSNSVATAFGIMGLIILLVGGGFIIFGPDEIYYNIYDGMTFVQYLQAYPGPIASVGFFILSLAQAAGKAADKKYIEAVNSCIDRVIHIKDEEIPEGQRLSIEFCEDESPTILVKLIEKPNEVELTPEEETA